MGKDLLICRLNDVYGKLLTDRQTEMIRRYYDDDLSLGEIAENEGITRQAVYDAINKGVAALKNYEETLNLNLIFEKLEEINQAMNKESIIDQIKSILDLRE